MFFHSKKQALEHFHSRFNEDEFTCNLNFHEIFNKYSYVANPISPTLTKQHNPPQAPGPKETTMGFQKSKAGVLSKSENFSPKASSLAADLLLKAAKSPAKRARKIEDEPLPDEAMKAVIASRAKRKKTVPYVREELTSVSTLNINQHDSDRPRCIYCGDHHSGIVRDHVVSVAWRGGVRHYDRSHTVPSCPQCNSLLGDKPLHNIPDRAAFLVGAIEHHERRYLFTVDRTAEELAELDHFLAISVKSAMFEKAVALHRIEYAKQVAAGYYDYATIKHLVKQGREIPEE